MRAIGRSSVDAAGRTGVIMFFDRRWQGCWTLENVMPDGHPDFGLFEFEPADQFCRWVDLDKETA